MLIKSRCEIREAQQSKGAWACVLKRDQSVRGSLIGCLGVLQLVTLRDRYYIAASRADGFLKPA